MDKCYITYNGYSSDQKKKKKKLSILHTTIPENIMYLKINKSSTHTVLEFSEALLFMSGKKKQNLKNNFFFFGFEKPSYITQAGFEFFNLLP